jgi:ADP-heptose:LPS heptosyltransferase
LTLGVQPELFRKKRNLWLAYGSEVMSPLLRLAAKARQRGQRQPRAKWRRGLIISHTHIGDILYRTCSLPHLREYLPDCEWSYAVSPGSAEVLANNPHISEVLPLIKGENSWDLVDGGFSALAERQFDVVICSNTLRNYPDLALASALGIPERVAFSGKGFSGLVNNPVAMGFPDAYASYFRRMVAAVSNSAPEWNLRPRLHPRESDERKADELWNAFGFDGTYPVVGISGNTRQASGHRPHEVLVSILEEARARVEFEIVLCGVAEDADHLRAVAADLRYPAKVLAGDARLLAFAAFLRKCSALLTLDSGPRHIGNAMGVPVFFARNLSHSMVEAGAYCETETDLAPPVEYLDDVETERVARSQPVGLLADKLVDRLTAASRRA